jgi:hypothetical protein
MAVAMEGDTPVFEIPIQGTGLWALALIDAAVPRADGGAVPPDAGAVDAGPTPADASAAAAPQLAALAPTSGAAATAVTLTLTGSMLADDATATFDGQRVATTRASPTTLSVAIPAALTGQAGQHAVGIENGPAGAASRSNVLYFLVTAPQGAPEIIDYSPDNGQPGDTVSIVGRNLAGATLSITDPAGTTAPPGAHGTITWLGASVETLQFVLPQGWQTGPITVAQDKGSYRGKIFNVGRDLARLPTAKATASSEYGGTWTIPRGDDNDLQTSWFSKNGDCATATGCTSVPWYRVDFGAPQTLTRVAMRGNREYMSGYDFLRGRFEVLGAGDAVLWSASYDLPEPDRDLDITLPTPIAGATAVKFTSEKDESVEPGFAELEAF